MGINDMNNRSLKVKCTYCNKDLLRVRKSKTGRHFCDKKCQKNWELVYVECEYCGKKLIRQPNKTNIYCCDQVCYGKYKNKLQGRVNLTKTFIIDEYILKGKTTIQIGAENNYNFSMIRTALIKHGIKLRPPRNTKGHQTSDITKKKISLAYWKNPRKGCLCQNWKGGITPQRQSLYGTDQWHKVRSMVWGRDNHECQRCGKKYTNQEKKMFAIHHIISFANKEKRCDPDNLILLCKVCHHWVHSRKNINKDFIKEF